MNSQKQQAIGIFDSGLGGLSVMREVMRQMPSEDIFYFADTARVPYGGRSAETIVEYALEAAQFLQKLPIKILIVACHTVSSRALCVLQSRFSIPVVGMVQAGIEDLCQSSYRRVAILGTQSTIESGVYQDFFQKHRPEIEVVPIACPLFVPMIEEGFSDHPAMELIARHYLIPLVALPVDAVLLGCTHYPLIRPLLRKILGDHSILVEPALRVVGETRASLQKMDLWQKERPSMRTFYVTDAPEKFQKQGSLFLGSSCIENIHKVSLKKMKVHETIEAVVGA